MQNFLALSLLSFVIVACQTKPTKIYESQPSFDKLGVAQSKDLILIDARSPFDYALAHIPDSISIQWSDFSQHENPYKGLLEKDLFFHARRLARLGISPNSKIFVVGNGVKGQGEEGRLAWTFKVMGIKNVQFGSIDIFSIPLTKAENPPKKNVTIWRPEENRALEISKNEFLNELFPQLKNGQGLIQSSSRPILIDVRTEKEYLGKDTSSYFSRNSPDLSAINIPWLEFLDYKGQANLQIVQKLESVGITKEKKIILIDDMGVRSAYITLILQDLGYQSATNFAGGYLELIGHPTNN